MGDINPSPECAQTRTQDIIAKLESASGPDRDTNEAVLRALGWSSREGFAYDPDGNLPRSIPDYVGSLDAALALVAEKLPDQHAGVMVEDRHSDGSITWGAWVDNRNPETETQFAKHPAIAVLLALFRALSKAEAA